MMKPTCSAASRRLSGFTLIELLVVIAIIVILAGLAFPAIRSLTKSNDQSQASNVLRSMISTARNIAISQQRMAGIVFFEETREYSSPVSATQTAMQIIVEDYDQTASKHPGKVEGTTVFVYYSRDRQYLPRGIQVATLSDTSIVTQSAENQTVGADARVILFDADGQLVLRQGIASPDPYAGGGTTAGQYPLAYGDWQFLRPDGKRAANSPFNPGQSAGSNHNVFASPGFLLYSKADYESWRDSRNPKPDDTARNNWLINHADVVIVNTYTGNINR